MTTSRSHTMQFEAREVWRVLAQAYPNKLLSLEIRDRSDSNVDPKKFGNAIANNERRGLFEKSRDKQAGKYRYGLTQKGLEHYEANIKNQPEPKKPKAKKARGRPRVAKPTPAPAARAPQEPDPLAKVSQEAMTLADHASVLVAQNAQYREALLSIRQIIDTALNTTAKQ